MRSTSLHFLVFFANGVLYDSTSVTRSAEQGHREAGDFDELTRDQLKKMAVGNQVCLGSCGAPEHGPLYQTHIVPAYDSEELKFIQVVMTTDFSTVITTPTGAREYRGAVALVYTVYNVSDYFLLMHSTPFLRTSFNMLLDFGMYLSIEFCENRNCYKSQTESGRAAVNSEEGHALGKKLDVALKALTSYQSPLPALSSKTTHILQGGVLGEHMALTDMTLTDSTSAVIEALERLVKYDKAFLSKIIVACVSGSRWMDYVDVGGNAVNQTNYKCYRSDELPSTRAWRLNAVARDAVEDIRDEMPEEPIQEDVRDDDVLPTGAASAIPFGATLDWTGGGWENSRIVILTQNESIGRCIMLICAFYFKAGLLVSMEHSAMFRHTLGPDADSLLSAVLAARCTSDPDSVMAALEFPLFPIQWIPTNDLSPQELELLLSCHSDDRTVSIIRLADNSVTRYQLAKTYSDQEAALGDGGSLVAIRRTFSSVNISRRVLEVDDTIIATVNQGLQDTKAAPLVFLEQRLEMEYHKALLYEYLVRHGMLEAYRFDAIPVKEMVNRVEVADDGDPSTDIPTLREQMSNSAAVRYSDRICCERYLGKSYTPSHGQMLHLMRFYQE